MKKVILHQILCGLLLLSTYSHFAVAKRPEIIDLNHIVAVVNKEVITSLQLDERLGVILKRLREKNTTLPPDAVLRKQVLEQMIMEQIQLQLAYSRGIRISDEQLNQIIEQIASDNRMSLDQFRQQLTNEGYNFARFRDEIRSDLIIKQLRKQEIENKIFVTDQEIKTEVANLDKNQSMNNEFHLGHILIPVSETASPKEIAAAKQKVDEVIGQLMLGRDFSEMAISVSAGQRALQGGDLGWLKQGQIPSIAVNVVSSLEIGQISEPIRSSSGFHILKLFDKRSNDSKHVVTQTRARHILIVPNAIVSNAQAKKKLNQIRDRILAGDDFAKLARATSDDPGSAANGGDLGWFGPGKMVPEFEEELKKLNPGEISQPFQSRFGWHIIEVISRRKQDDTDAFLNQQARSLIQKRRSIEQTSIWLRRIRDEAYVDIRLDE